MKNHFADLLDELQFPNLKQKKKKKNQKNSCPNFTFKTSLVSY